MDNKLNHSIDNEIDNLIMLSKEKLQLNFIDYSLLNNIIKLTNNIDCPLYIHLIALFNSLNQGSSSLKLSVTSLQKNLNFLDSSKLSELLTLFLNNIQNGSYNEIIGLNNDFKPIIYYNGYLYFHKYYVNEMKLKKIIDLRLERNNPPDYNSLEKIKSSFNSLLEISKIKFDFKQQIAILNSIIMDFYIISGGPGTGKTTIITAILFILIKIGYKVEDISILSPTGKASLRITESIRNQLDKNFNPNEYEREQLSTIEASTIHRLLRYSPLNNEFIFNENNLLPMKFFIIDEVSMVDLILMSKLLSSIHVNSKIIFVGDKNQLPSVEAGTVLNKLIPDTNAEYFNENNINLLKSIIPDLNLTPITSSSRLINHFIILSKPYRYSGNLQEITENMQNNIETDLINKFTTINKISQIENNDTADNCFLIENKGKNDLLLNLITEWTEKFFLRNNNYLNNISIISKTDLNVITKDTERIFKDLFNIIDSNKILTFVRESAYGHIFINRIMKNLFIESKIGLSGIPLIITKNDYEKDIFNGDIGILLKDIKQKNYCIFKSFDSFKIFDLKSLHFYEESFAITVHKSQGSEYDNVLVILPSDINNKLLKKELIYTALTRARKSCSLFSSKEILKIALSNKIERESGIDFWENNV